MDPLLLEAERGVALRCRCIDEMTSAFRDKRQCWTYKSEVCTFDNFDQFIQGVPRVILA